MANNLSLEEQTKAEIIQVLDAAKRSLHAAAMIHFNGNIHDPLFCELNRKANAVAVLRRRIYQNEVEV